MGYTHYFTFKTERGTATETERLYQKAIRECQKAIKAYYAEHGGLIGYSAHTKLGQYGGIELNGKGEEGYESFNLREHASENDWGFCKTNRKPYDTVVVACLAILKHRLRDAIDVSSDGRVKDWVAGVELARRVTRLAVKVPESIRV